MCLGWKPEGIAIPLKSAPQTLSYTTLHQLSDTFWGSMEKIALLLTKPLQQLQEHWLIVHLPSPAFYHHTLG